MLTIGNTEVSGIYIGNTPVLSAFLGSQLIWSNEQPTPPSPEDWYVLSGRWDGATAYNFLNGRFWFGNDQDGFTMLGNSAYTITSGLPLEALTAFEIRENGTQWAIGQSLLNPTGTYTNQEYGNLYVMVADKVIQWGTTPITIVGYTTQNIEFTFYSSLAPENGEVGMYIGNYSGSTIALWHESGWTCLGYGTVDGDRFITSIVEYHANTYTLYRKMSFDSLMETDSRTFYFLT